MIFSVLYLLVRCLLGSLIVLARRQASKAAELLVLQHENGATPSDQPGPLPRGAFAAAVHLFKAITSGHLTTQALTRLGSWAAYPPTASAPA